MAGIALTATVGLAACGTDDNNSSSSPTNGSSSAAAISCATGTVNAQGSTAQTNAIGQLIKDYDAKCSGATINYTANGSGAGQTAFISGTADFAGSDSALTAAQMPDANKRCATGNAVDLPMVVGPIAVVYHVGSLTNLQFKAATLADIFSGKITTWDNAEIKADNPGVSLPSTQITAVHREDASGTSDNFTNYLGTVAPTNWTYPHAKAWPTGLKGDAENGSAGISTELAKTDGSIGYVEWSYATLNSLNMAKIYNGAGEWSSLTADSAGKTIAGATVVGTGDDLSLKIDYTTTTAGAYPIVLATYEIVCETGTPSAALPLVKSFLTYASSAAGQQSLVAVGSAPLPETIRTKVAAIVAKLS